MESASLTGSVGPAGSCFTLGVLPRFVAFLGFPKEYTKRAKHHRITQMGIVPRVLSLTATASATAILMSPALAQNSVSHFELISSPSNHVRGSNFIVITGGLRKEATPREELRARSWNDVVTLDQEKLRRLVEEHQLGVTPSYALTAGLSGRGALRVVGLRNHEVWDCLLDGSNRSQRRVGRAVDSDDARLRGYEQSVAGAKLVLAYETIHGGVSDVKRELTAIVQAQNNVYAVNKMSPTAYAIAQLGTVDDVE